MHGDIKPGNIVVYDNNKTVKLTDFGVAKIMSEIPTEGYKLGMERKLGSVRYMAPEVIRGEPRDFQNDIFSLGIVAYLLFTGQHPFYDPHPSGLFSVKDNLLSKREAKNIEEINSDIPKACRTTIMKMIMKNKDGRYPNIKQAYEDFVEIGLVCSHCRYNNPVNASYCMDCGKSLKTVRDDQYKDKSPEELIAKAFQLNSILQFNEAIKFCDAAIALKKDHGPAYHTRGWAQSSLAKYPKAREDFKLALKYTRDSVQVANIHTNIGYTYMMEHDYSRLIEELEKALKCNPDHYKAKQLLEKYEEYRK